MMVSKGFFLFVIQEKKYLNCRLFKIEIWFRYFFNIVIRIEINKWLLIVCNQKEKVDISVMVNYIQIFEKW